MQKGGLSMKIAERSEWKSKTCARKGWVLWTHRGKVKICFTNSRIENFKVHTKEDFLRLYEKQ